MTSTIDPWFIENLVCPVDQSRLEFLDGQLKSASGRVYPVVDGIPVMLLANEKHTIGLAENSFKRAHGDQMVIDQRAPELYLESLGMSESQKEGVLAHSQSDEHTIDPVVSFIIAATNGHAYKQLIGKLTDYPIPDLRLPESDGALFLDLGCNWGRWCLAAARKGYTPIGIDPSLGAVMAARRVADQLDLPVRYLVADARFLPFKTNSIDQVFSYSVLQHLSKENVRVSLEAVGRILKPGGVSLIQMPNFLGIRCLQHQLKRGFRAGRDFDVRYWSVPELIKNFGSRVGASTVTVDCYFGLGLQKSDMNLMSPFLRTAVRISEYLRYVSRSIKLLTYLADSVYVESRKPDA